MKRLILMRHGKSSWEFDVSDKERPLKQRGVNDAKLVALVFKQKEIKVDAVYSSPAKRAFTTAQLACEVLDIPETTITSHDELYDFHGQSVLYFIKSLADNLDTVMIFGHNHAFTSIVNLYGSEYLDNLPTAGAAILDFDINSWDALDKGITSAFILPRDYK